MKNEGLNKSYQEFISNYFSNIEGVKKLYDRVFKEEDFNGTLQDWYTKFVCDLAWAKNTQYCNTNNSNSGNSGGSSTPRTRGTILNPQDYEGIDFKYKYPGDRNYRYGVKGTDWYAKNINNGNTFNISKETFAVDSVKRLNTQFPNAFKEVVQPVSPETKTPETPTQDSTKVVTNVPPVKPMDSTNTGTNIPPQVKPVDSTTDEPDDLTDKTTDEPDDLTNY